MGGEANVDVDINVEIDVDTCTLWMWIWRGSSLRAFDDDVCGDITLALELHYLPALAALSYLTASQAYRRFSVNKIPEREPARSTNLLPSPLSFLSVDSE